MCGTPLEGNRASEGRLWGASLGWQKEIAGFTPARSEPANCPEPRGYRSKTGHSIEGPTDLQWLHRPDPMPAGA